MTPWRSWPCGRTLFALVVLSCGATRAAAQSVDDSFDSNGVRIHYRVQGRGEPVVLVHGLMANIGFQWDAPRVLEALANDYRVVALDNRGHGGSEKPHEADKYGAEMVEDVVRLLDHLQIDTAHVVGYSMGGFIANKLLATHPERVRSAVIAGAGWLRADDPQIMVLEELADSLEAGRGVAPLLKALNPRGRPVPSDAQLAVSSRLILSINDVKAITAAVRGLPELHVTESELAANRTPALAIVGGDDPLKAAAELLVGKMPQLKMVTLQGADHVDAPFRPEFVAAIRNFLQANAVAAAAEKDDLQITETDEEIRIETPEISAVVRKRGYVSGVAGGTFVDKRTGASDLGYGLDIVDWIMEPGSDEAYRKQLPGDLPYEFDNLVHGKIPKRSIEGPQICTKARQVEPKIVRGRDFISVQMRHRYTLAAPGKKAGSLWTQTLVFPRGKRYFVSCDRIDAVNDSPAMFLRIDMPGHIKHDRGDSFSEAYLSYHGRIGSREFIEDFAPDERFLYRRDERKLPERMIRGYRIRNPRTGQDGPWLAGLTLDPTVASEAWCHQRGYVCMIEEFGGRPVKAGGAFQAAFIVGYFDSIEEMYRVYDEHKGHTGLEVTADGWKLVE